MRASMMEVVFPPHYSRGKKNTKRQNQLLNGTHNIFLSTQWSETTTGWHCNLEWVLFMFFRIQLYFLPFKVKQYQHILTSLDICFLESLSTKTPRSAMRKAMCFFLWVSSITSVREADALFAAWKIKTENHQ